MKPTIIKRERSIELKIPYDLVSTRISELKLVFDELDSILTGSPRDHIIIDFAGCEMVDSAGLNYLVSLQKFLQPKSCEVKLHATNKNLVRTFKFSRLDQFMEIVTS